MKTITIDYDQRCARCGREGVTPNGLCLTCNGKLLTKRLIDRAKKGDRPCPKHES